MSLPHSYCPHYAILLGVAFNIQLGPSVKYWFEYIKLVLTCWTPCSLFFCCVWLTMGVLLDMAGLLGFFNGLEPDGPESMIRK